MLVDWPPGQILRMVGSVSKRWLSRDMLCLMGSMDQRWLSSDRLGLVNSMVSWSILAGITRSSLLPRLGVD